MDAIIMNTVNLVLWRIKMKLAERRVKCWEWCTQCNTCHKGYIQCTTDCKDYRSYIDDIELRIDKHL